MWPAGEFIMESWFESMLCYYAARRMVVVVSPWLTCDYGETKFVICHHLGSLSLLLATHPTHVRRILLHPFPYSPINRYTRLLSHRTK